MNQKSTPSETRNYHVVSGNTVNILNPGKKTLSFIKQFAYSYHVEKKLPTALAGMVLN